MIQLRIVNGKINVTQKHFNQDALRYNIVHQIECDTAITYASMSCNWKYISCILDDNRVAAYSIESDLKRIFCALFPNRNLCCISDDGNILAIKEPTEGKLTLWNISEKLPIQAPNFGDLDITEIKSLCNNRFLITLQRNGAVSHSILCVNNDASNLFTCNYVRPTVNYFGTCVTFFGNERGYFEMEHRDISTLHTTTCRDGSYYLHPNDCVQCYGSSNYAVATLRNNVILVFRVNGNIAKPYLTITNADFDPNYVYISPNERYVISKGIWCIKTGHAINDTPSSNLQRLVKELPINDIFVLNLCYFVRCIDHYCLFSFGDLMDYRPFKTICDCIEHEGKGFIFTDKWCVVFSTGWRQKKHAFSYKHIQLHHLDGNVVRAATNDVYPNMFQLTTETGTTFQQLWNGTEFVDHKIASSGEDMLSLGQEVFLNRSMLQLTEHLLKNSLEDVELRLSTSFDQKISMIEKQHADAMAAASGKQEMLERKLKEADMKLQEINFKMDAAISVILDSKEDSKCIEELQKYAEQCFTEFSNIILPSGETLRMLEEAITVDMLPTLSAGMSECVMFSELMDNAIHKFDLNYTLAASIQNRISDFEPQNTATRIIYEHVCHRLLEKARDFDQHFVFLEECSNFDFAVAFNECQLLNDTYSRIPVISDAYSELWNQLQEEKPTKRRRRIRKKKDTHFDVNMLNELNVLIQRCLEDLECIVDSRFTTISRELKYEYMTWKTKLDKLTESITLNLNLKTQLEKIKVDDLPLPCEITSMSSELYLNGALDNESLDNCKIALDNKFIKCFCICDDCDTRDDNIKALRRELRVLSRKSKHIVALKNIVFVAVEEDEELYVEFVCLELELAFMDLDKYLIENPDLCLKTRNSLAQQMISCVSYMRSSGIIIRDIKPQNFLIFCHDTGLSLKMCDFGVSIDTTQTLISTTTVGTINFMAPEVREPGHPHTFMSDIYSLGETLRYVYGQNDAHSDVLSKCLSPNPLDRPSIFDLYVYFSPKDESIRSLSNRYMLSKICSPPFECTIDSESDFVHVFENYASCMGSDNEIGFRISRNSMLLTFEEFADDIQTSGMVPLLSEQTSTALAVFTYCCLIFGVPINDILVGNVLLNAISRDHDDLLSERVFSRIFPSEYASFDIEEMDLTENMNVSMMSSQIHRIFHSGKFAAEQHLSELSFHEIKSILCREPHICSDDVFSCFTFKPDVSDRIRESLRDVLADMRSDHLTNIISWLFGSYNKTHSISVVLQSDPSLGVSLGFSGRVLRVSSCPRRTRMGIIKRSVTIQQ
ncbi:hypothetical protein PCE1_003228 [Barthelona sp. PCE]